MANGTGPWTTLPRFLRRYEREWSLAKWLPWPRRQSTRVEVIVFGRAGLMLVLVWFAYPLSWLYFLLFLVATWTFVDCLIVVTQHAFYAPRQLDDRFRYVALNLVGFLTLTPWFAILLAPLASHFDPRLTWATALRTTWSATTASAVIQGARPITKAAYLALGVVSTVGVYFLIVVLVMAVAKATPPDQSDPAG